MGIQETGRQNGNPETESITRSRKVSEMNRNNKEVYNSEKNNLHRLTG